MNTRKYISYLTNPLELLRTQKVLHVNPTVAPARAEPEQVKIFVYDYNQQNIDVKELSSVPACYPI
jgi:magnesium transporter